MSLIREISADEWHSIPGAFKIMVGDFPRRFMALDFSSFTYGIAWNSQLIEPSILELHDHDLLLVAVDQRVVAISFTNGSVKLSLGLADNFLFYLHDEHSFTVVSENTITVFNANGCSISRVMSVPDIIVSVTPQDGKLIVKCLSEAFVL